MQLAPPACKRLVTTWEEAMSVFNKMLQAVHEFWYVRFSIQGALNPSPTICHFTTFYILSGTEADICAACHSISHLLWKLRVRVLYGAHNILNSLPSWNNSIHWMSLLYSLILSYRLGPFFTPSGLYTCRLKLCTNFSYFPTVLHDVHVISSFIWSWYLDKITQWEAHHYSASFNLYFFLYLWRNY